MRKEPSTHLVGRDKSGKMDRGRDRDRDNRRFVTSFFLQFCSFGIFEQFDFTTHRILGNAYCIDI